MSATELWSDSLLPLMFTCSDLWPPSAVLYIYYSYMLYGLTINYPAPETSS